MHVIEQINEKEKLLLQTEFAEADKILVGLGTGMALSAGLAALPLEQKQPDEQYWQFWQPYIEEQRLQPEENSVYRALSTLLSDRNYFIIDANPDGMLYHHGVDANRIYKVQGDMARTQCKFNCNHKVYPVRHNLQKLKEGKQAEICCPECGAPLVMNICTDPFFCESPYEKQKAAYFDFVNGSAQEKLLVLEIGVGYTIPEMIRFPFEYIVQNHPHAKLIRINTLHPLCVEENSNKAICIGCDAGEVLKALTR